MAIHLAYDTISAKFVRRGRGHFVYAAAVSLAVDETRREGALSRQQKRPDDIDKLL